MGETKTKRQKRNQTEEQCFDPPEQEQGFSHIGGVTNGEVNAEFLVDDEMPNMR